MKYYNDTVTYICNVKLEIQASSRSHFLLQNSQFLVILLFSLLDEVQEEAERLCIQYMLELLGFAYIPGRDHYTV